MARLLHDQDDSIANLIGIKARQSRRRRPARAAATETAAVAVRRFSPAAAAAMTAEESVYTGGPSRTA
jgi:hypothetical protein